MDVSYRVIQNDDQPVLESGRGTRSRVIAAAHNSATRMSVVERWLDPGAEMRLHRHPEGIEEVIWVRSGDGEFRVGDEIAVVGADHTIVIPPLAWHSFRVVGDAELYVLSRYSAAVPVTLTEEGGKGEPEVPGTREASPDD